MSFLRLDRIAGLNPGVKTANERMNVFETVIEKLSCHTGTPSFVWSGAIRNDGAIGYDLIEIVFYLFS
jgi:hypothetical protein